MNGAWPVLSPAVQAALLQALDDSGASEICGLLFRRREGQEQAFRRLRNYGGAGEFLVEQAELDSVLRALAREDAAVLAFVHSHRSAPGLSHADQAALRTSPWPWVVVMRQPDGLAVHWYQAG